MKMFFLLLVAIIIHSIHIHTQLFFLVGKYCIILMMHIMVLLSRFLE